MAYIKLPVSKHLPGFMALGKQDLNSWLATPKPISPQVHWLPLAKSNETMYFGKKGRAIIQTSSEETEGPSCLKLSFHHKCVFYSKEQRDKASLPLSLPAVISSVGLHPPGTSVWIFCQGEVRCGSRAHQKGAWRVACH